MPGCVRASFVNSCVPRALIFSTQLQLLASSEAEDQVEDLLPWGSIRDMRKTNTGGLGQAELKLHLKQPRSLHCKLKYWGKCVLDHHILKADGWETSVPCGAKAKLRECPTSFCHRARTHTLEARCVLVAAVAASALLKPVSSPPSSMPYRPQWSAVGGGCLSLVSQRAVALSGVENKLLAQCADSGEMQVNQKTVTTAQLQKTLNSTVHAKRTQRNNCS